MVEFAFRNEAVEFDFSDTESEEDPDSLAITALAAKKKNTKTTS